MGTKTVSSSIPSASLLCALAVMTTSAAAAPASWVFEGMCDASAAVAPGSGGVLLVANDEDNVLRLYRPAQGSAPVETVDLDAFLGVGKKRREADVEGATQIGARSFWITSHGTNKKGKPRPERRRLFALDVTTSAGGLRVVPVGTPYARLVDDLIAAPSLHGFNLDEAAQKPPKEGGLNIEGLAATPEGALLVGLRAPLREGRALVVVVENPDDVVLGRARARIGPPRELALGGLGVRSLEHSVRHGGYLVVAGPPDGGGTFRLFLWSGATDDVPRPLPFDPALGAGWTPEAIVPGFPDEARVLLLSDDGTATAGKTACKDAPASRQRFRALALPSPSLR